MRRLLPALTLLLLYASSIEAQTPPAPGTATTVDASRGGLTVISGPNSLTLGARMQFRWTLDDREYASADTAGSGLGAADGATSQFDVPRLRVSLTGGAFKPWLRYAFQVDFSRTSGESASKIKDAIIEVRPIGRTYRITGGQFKVPFGLQQLTSSGRLQFVDRAITDAKFSPARDMGVMVSGTVARRKVGFDAGVFNGSGESVRQRTRAHLLAARLYLQPLGSYSLSEGANDGGTTRVLHLGVGARSGKEIRGRTTPGVVEDADDQRAFNAEFAIKAARLFATAEYFWMRNEQNNPVRAAAILSRGFHAQGGYMVVPKRAELGFLAAQIVPDRDVDKAAVSEWRGVFGYYWHGHGLKLQADAGRVRYGSNFGRLSPRARQGLPPLGDRLVSGQRLSDTQVRLQLQLAF